jgi:hypothetical protein
MVPETGIEPVTFALEGRCSSTELLGQKWGNWDHTMIEQITGTIEPEKLIQKGTEVKGFYMKNKFYI